MIASNALALDPPKRSAPSALIRGHQEVGGSIAHSFNELEGSMN
jgi:hypothetical protein